LTFITTLRAVILSSTLMVASVAEKLQRGVGCAQDVNLPPSIS
jgi:hypothetical protein